MNALSLPSSAVIRSRCARTTSTGETCFCAIIRARSAAGIQCRASISENPVLRGRLGLAEVHGVEARQQVEAPLGERTQRLELGVLPLESGEAGQPLQRVQGYFHVREHTTRMWGHGRG